jgi:hypothetical protein
MGQQASSARFGRLRPQSTLAGTCNRLVHDPCSGQIEFGPVGVSMAETSWEAAMTRLAAAQRDFANGDAAGLKGLYSHREDVTVYGGFGGCERGWSEVAPRLDWAASHFSGGTYNQQDLSATVGTDVACLVSLERWSYTDPSNRVDTLLE